MGVQYTPNYVAECWACDDGFMRGSRRGGSDVMLTCTQCENAFPASFGDNRIEAIGLSYGMELDLQNYRSLDEVVSTAMSSDGMVVLDLEEARPLYYSLQDGQECPVRGCGGSLRETGSSSSMTTQKSCDTCDFETFEKDVS